MKDLKDMLSESRRDTNKEIEKKAEELAKKHMPFAGVPITECIDACNEMADWMKGYMIEKAYSWMDKNIDKYFGASGTFNDVRFFSDFKDTMEK